jgi:hypothetical protein
MMLIATELTELEEARNNVDALPKDTMNSEYADVLMRTLHLGTVWEVDFNSDREFVSKIKSKLGNFQLTDLLYLHDLVSTGYESYRHKKIDSFQQSLYLLAREVVTLSQSEGVEIEKGVMDKIDINRSRLWSGKEINEHLSK